MLLTNEARIITSVDALYLHFGSTTETPSLLPKRAQFWNDLTRAITSHTVFKAKLNSLKCKAAAAGELEVITHDETFKTLFAIIGQKKMSQKHGEIHALHTFRGFTGCTLGVSAQRSTSSECFRAAAAATFEDKLAEKVKFIFSDCPSRIYHVATKIFKSLIAVGEDAIHLPIRLEYCWGEKKTKASVRVRQLHRKFGCPTITKEPFWSPESDNTMVAVWPDNPTEDNRTDDQWVKYCKESFNGEFAHREYAVELSKIAKSHEEYMTKKNAKGVTAGQILRSGTAWHHFQALQNSSRLLARLGSKGKRLGVGTTRNEQLHMELKAWGRNIYQAHVGRLRCSFRIFEFAKLMTHSSAAYYPTLIQTRQRRLLCIIASRLRTSPFFPSCSPQLENRPVQIELCRADLHKPESQIDSVSGKLRKQEEKENQIMWKKEKRKRLTKKRNTTDVFKRRRLTRER